ncbi:MAG TPA: tRNA (adenosine(37)-N6)-threonylcarbamoyltransferase complex ATPase subunit type 1 TsaE [Phaeodactylibacter sp.]|nr:tRNA (adenosine(37)-N6)-threonylcarbamoyltransferase complex ATPase subunit type 1 TsaE [Phaeodactylibacter sp.]
MEITIHSIADLEKVATALFDFSEGKKKMMFYGEIGAGKTTFIKILCKHLGVKESVVSPTFSLVNEYIYTDKLSGKEKLVHHLDLYRLKSEEEALDIGIEDYLYDENYCFIEWAEIIEHWLPDDFVKIHIEIMEHSERKFIFN